MTVEQVFLGCFLFGFIFSLLGVVAGSAHLHIGAHHHGLGHHGAGGFGKFNGGTIAAFLTWFGGAGYILSSVGRIGIALVILIAVAIGLVGAAILFLVIAKLLAPADQPLDPADYRMIGALGTVSSPVRPNGTGEMIFLQQGRRAAVPIRSESGSPIPSGKEVVVTRYEHGIAYVREWEELTA
ncbi:MAG TPA: NfeD family protein [Bryobacteraceae bacterium]|jgi:membrane-bound ClpP family serine protease|nr:NfeD family protein [Bryobacteraceae bacterium]